MIMQAAKSWSIVWGKWNAHFTGPKINPAPVKILLALPELLMRDQKQVVISPMCCGRNADIFSVGPSRVTGSLNAGEICGVGRPLGKVLYV